MATDTSSVNTETSYAEWSLDRKQRPKIRRTASLDSIDSIKRPKLNKTRFIPIHKPRPKGHQKPAKGKAPLANEDVIPENIILKNDGWNYVV